MKRLVVSIMLVFPFVLSFAQQPPAFLNRKVNGEVILKNGKKLSGRFKVPGIRSGTINFFEGDEEKEPISSEDIQYLISKSDNGRVSVLEYTLVGKLKKSKGEIITKVIGKQKAWLLLLVPGDRAKLYIAGTGFKAYKDGTLEAVVYGNAQDVSSFNYYGKIEGRDEVPVFIDLEMAFGKTVNKNATFKMYGPMFFRDDADLSQKIKNKEEGFRSADKNKIFSDYNDR